MAANLGVYYRAFSIDYHGRANKLKTTIRILCGDGSAEGTAQWDTGATMSCISEPIAKQLNLIPTGMMNIQTPSGTKCVKTYSVDVELPNHLTVTDIQVCETDIDKQGIQMLVGMDIISLGDFAVSNYNGNTMVTFRYPSRERINFVPQSNIDNVIGQRHGKGKKNKKRKNK